MFSRKRLAPLNQEILSANFVIHIFRSRNLEAAHSKKFAHHVKYALELQLVDSVHSEECFMHLIRDNCSKYARNGLTVFDKQLWVKYSIGGNSAQDRSFHYVMRVPGDLLRFCAPYMHVPYVGNFQQKKTHPPENRFGIKNCRQNVIFPWITEQTELTDHILVL